MKILSMHDRGAAMNDSVRAIDLILTLRQWCDVCDVAPELVSRRLKRGEIIFDALTAARGEQVIFFSDADVFNFVKKNKHGASLTKVARALNIHRHTVKAIEKKALAKIKKMIEARDEK